jgi:hypothetical protein
VLQTDDHKSVSLKWDAGNGRQHGPCMRYTLLCFTEWQLLYNEPVCSTQLRGKCFVFWQTGDMGWTVGVQFLAVATEFSLLHTGSGTHLATYAMDTRGRSVKLTTHLHLVQRSRMVDVYTHSPIRLGQLHSTGLYSA